MAAALRREWNGHGALGAVFGGRCGSLCRFRREPINLLDHQKNAKSHDQKIDHRVQEDSIVERCGVVQFRVGEKST